MNISPEYGLLVKGPWGCGKSHLVKSCIRDLEQRNKKFKFLYVSLYGINDVSDIEAKFFEQLNPILSNKKLMFAGQIAKGILKGALKLDLDGDGKVDATANLAVPDINLANYFTDISNCILVFDDLERCELDTGVILGYLNYYIEKDGYKVIIIADEEKLLNQTYNTDKNNQYVVTKEKLIGKTVEIESDVKQVFDSFIKELFSESISNNTQEFMELNKEKIIQRYNQSNYKNLRSLRKSLLDLKQFIDVFDSEIKENIELLSHFVSLFTALSMEIHSGMIKPSQMSDFMSFSSQLKSAVEESKGRTKNNFTSIKKKYDINFSDTLIDIKDWIDYFSKGYLNQNSIFNALKRTKYFQNKNTPNWKKLWYFFNLEDEEFLELQTSVQLSFNNRDYDDVGVLKHIAGMFLDHINLGLSTKEPSEVVKDVIRYLNERSSFNIHEGLIGDLNRYSGYENLGYTSIDTKEFKEVSSLINDFVDKYLSQKLEITSYELLTNLVSNPDTVIDLFDSSTSVNGSYYNKAILHYIKPTDFLEAFLKIPNRKMREFSIVLLSRYKHSFPESTLLVELDWLEELVEEISTNLKISPPAISKIILNNFQESLLNTIEEIKTR